MESAAQTQRSREYEPVHFWPPAPPQAAAPQAVPQQAAAPAPAARRRLLIISDNHQCIADWQAALPEHEWEITGLTVLPWLSRILQRPYDIAVVDVATAELAKVLATLREAKHMIPILVEASRLPNDLSCAGVLPRYRAMPGVQTELLRLVKHCQQPATAEARQHRLL
jgi:kynureninase